MSPVDVEAVLLRAAVLGVAAVLAYRSSWWWLASWFERIEQRSTDSPVEAVAEAVREQVPPGRHALVEGSAELTSVDGMAGELIPFRPDGGDAA